MKLHAREWGSGEAVIALHPLGLESSAFAGFGEILAARGMRTIALDLPGFGRTPAMEGALTPARLAAPVLAHARQLRQPAALIGISLGGRVALECALTAPELFRSVIAIQPYMPWLRFRQMLEFARLMSPELAGRIPVDRLWPLLRGVSWLGQFTPFLGDDEIAQSGVRLVYNLSCPATRVSLVSAARELALDPAFGNQGFWTRLPRLRVPAAFVWGKRDRLVTARFAERVADSLPAARQLVLPCLGHSINGPHHRCLARTVAALLEGAPPSEEPGVCAVRRRAA
jgi:pimeloyl-ACP methyl ester carboxylesterase